MFFCLFAFSDKIEPALFLVMIDEDPFLNKKNS